MARVWATTDRSPEGIARELGMERGRPMALDHPERKATIALKDDLEKAGKKAMHEVRESWNVTNWSKTIEKQIWRKHIEEPHRQARCPVGRLRLVRH